MQGTFVTDFLLFNTRIDVNLPVRQSDFSSRTADQYYTSLENYPVKGDLAARLACLALVLECRDLSVKLMG